MNTPTFEDVARLTDRELQTFLREVDQRDLIVGLAGASEALTQKCLANMSEGVRSLIEEEVALVTVSKGEITQVQKRIAQHVTLLVEQGQVAWPPKTGTRKPKVKRPSKKYLAGQRQMKQQAKRLLSEQSSEEINSLFVAMSEKARKEGILSLEDVGQAAEDPFIRAAVRLMVDGTEPALIMDIMGTWKNSLMHEHETKYDKVIEAIMAIQAGDNPHIVGFKLEVLY